MKNLNHDAKKNSMNENIALINIVKEINTNDEQKLCV